MSQTTIPLQFEKYLLDKITAGAAPNMNEFVFAYIPNLDPAQPIDRATGLPAENFIVHRQNVDQTARLNRNTLIYSVIVPSKVAPFTFNAIYLHDKNVQESCGLIVHKPAETKESGMATTKSVAQEYDGAAEIAGIHIDPATWQIDYHARLFGIDEEIRLTQLDKYGHTAFISGFNVVKLTSNDYRVDPGIVYVGGLRCELKTAVTRTVTAKPNGLYVDVVREGSTLSKWVNVPTIKVSNTPLSDYVDEQGYQHYVTRLAGIDASGKAQDWREWDIVSKTEAEEGISTKARNWTAQRVRQAIVAWWDSIPKGTAFNKNFGSTAGTVCPGNDSRLSDAREWLANTVSQAEAEAGESVAPRKWTAQRVRQAIVAWWDSIPKGTAFNKNFGSTAGTVCPGNDSRLSDAREWLANTVSQAEAEGGASNTPRKWTAQRVHQAFNQYGLGTDKSSNIDDLSLMPKKSGFYQTTANPDFAPAGTRTTFSALISSINTLRAGAIIMGAGDGLSPSVNNSIYYTWMNNGLWNAPILELLHAGNERQIGVNQKYYNVIQDRVGGAIYTNSTERPILVVITTTPMQTHYNALLVRPNSSSNFITVGASSGAASTGISAIIPPGFEYKLDVPNNQIQLWVELR
ncbi:phage tail protein [Vibrio cholerae]|uniref:phage tail-collar fiber domain-containing protein n=1 Tax=Vibrio cholerae TaxID=666 RepID=UPI0013027784|nr:phage tail protein [Vibrio cholerae]EKF9473135.1 phage tail protein [Vibrio cholerae]EKF9727283.1 phage tail protein [Vibrio cholerae]HCF7777582.1 phage tail protein [Vibrio cholerae]HCF7785282.1 phage tail protein [Vibrio cholerae]